MAILYRGNMAKRTTSRNRAPQRRRPVPPRKARPAKPSGPKKATPPRRGRKGTIMAGGAARSLTPAEIAEVFRRFEAANPAPEGELKHVDPYTLLVAVVLSAQATDVGVNKATGPLFAVADTPAAMVKLGEERLRDYIKTIGLYRGKAKNVIALSRRLLAEHGGQVPPDRAALESMPAVGR